MEIKQTLASLFCIGLFFGSTSVTFASANDNHDFGEFCKAFSEITEDKSSFNTDDDILLRQRLDTKLSADSPAYISWMAVSAALAGYRYNLMLDAAASTGLESWDCPALKRVFPPNE